MEVAQFYDREKKYDAALVYYNSVVQKFPDAEIARRASVRADEIKRHQYEMISKEPVKETPPVPEVSPEVPSENTTTNSVTNPVL
jgi:hypothetical protein